jgi:hypothetical protein
MESEGTYLNNLTGYAEPVVIVALGGKRLARLLWHNGSSVDEPLLPSVRCMNSRAGRPRQRKESAADA